MKYITNQKKQDENKTGVNPTIAAITGAVVGAGFAVAGAIALKDKKTRDKVKQTLTNVKDQAINYIKEIQNQAQDSQNRIDKKLIEGKEKVKK